MSERIKRTDLNQLIRAYKGGEFDVNSVARARNFQQLRKVFVTNATGADLSVGQKVYINGRRATFETLLNEYLNDGYFFSGVSYSAASDNPFGFCLEPIKQNNLGEVVIYGICPALMDSETSTHKYAKINDSGQLVSTADEEEAEFWKAEASSDAVSGKHFAYLVAKPKPPEVGGHLVGEVMGTAGQDDIVGTGTGSVKVYYDANQYTVYENVGCPLLRNADGNTYPAEKITAGSKVILSKNRISGEWQIIEAQCPRS